MSTFIERLLQEEIELNEKISKLEKFIDYTEEWNTIDREQRGFLLIQLKAMRTYAEILNIRLIDINEKEAEQKNVSPLDAPSAHPLDVLLRELKWGRKAAQQHLIDKWIAELESDEPIRLYTQEEYDNHGREMYEKAIKNYGN